MYDRNGRAIEPGKKLRYGTCGKRWEGRVHLATPLFVRVTRDGDGKVMTVKSPWKHEVVA